MSCVILHAVQLADSPVRLELQLHQILSFICVCYSQLPADRPFFVDVDEDLVISTKFTLSATCRDQNAMLVSQCHRQWLTSGREACWNRVSEVRWFELLIQGTVLVVAPPCFWS